MDHRLVIRILVPTVVLLAVGMGATAFLGSSGRGLDGLAGAHVRAAALAADAWYQDPFGGHGSYRNISSEALVREAPAVSSGIRAFSLAGGRAYCLADDEGPGHSAYYVGGDTRGLTELRGAVTGAVTLVRSAATDATAVCAAIS